MTDAPPFPRRKPGYVSPPRKPPGVSALETAELIAAGARGTVGVIFIAAALLFLPIHFMTTIMSGIGVMMVVSGAYAAWLLGRREPRLRPVCRIVVVVGPALCIGIFLLTAVMGPGAFAPDWRDLVAPRPLPTFQPRAGSE